MHLEHFAFSAILLAPALLFVASAALGRGGWRVTQAAAWAAFAASVGAAAGAALATVEPAAWLRSAPLNHTMLVLISFIALVIIRFSARYLAGDPAAGRYRLWLQLCLASVSAVVMANHLLLLWLGWTAISISLHQLLVLYPERFRAVLAAHKKFLLARLAELSLLGACILLWQQHDTLHIDTILAAYAGGAALGAAEQAAALLLALAALIKCAQLPLHGWLIQVVEAPTPVSALLHAGIINLGGYLLLLMAPLISLSTAATWLLLIVAGCTAVLAALITMTRVSVKVMLAWSTSAQMGLMLVECALGLYALALLHLVAHSCYKAYAFLRSGSAVNDYLSGRLAPVAKPSGRGLLSALVASIAALTLLGSWLSDALAPAEFSAWLLVALAATLLISEQRASRLPRAALAAVAAALFLATAYGLQKLLFAQLLPPVQTVGWPAAAWAALLFALLFAGYWLLRYRHGRPAVQRLYATLFAGLYLDEWFTRMTLKLWPVQLPSAKPRKTPFLASRSPINERCA